MSELTISGVTISVSVQIQQLISEFAYRIDLMGGDTVAELFAEDGYYEADGKRSTGRKAIREAYELRSARGPRQSRHLFTNLRVVGTDGSTYCATTIMLLFARDGYGIHAAEPLLVADIEDVYQMDQNGEIVIKSRRLTTVFADPAHQPILPLGHEIDSSEVIGESAFE